MDVSKLKRDAAFVLSQLTVDKSDGWVTKKDARIYIPSKYSARNLASLDNGVRVVAIFPIVIGDKYSVMKVNANIDLTPTSSRTVTINDEEFVEFFFEAGSHITKSLNLVQTALLVYSISDHFLSRGDVPWFMNYQDLSELFDSCKKHAGTDLKVDPAILEVITASLSRQPKDRTKYRRHALKTQADFNGDDVTYISLKNIELGATNTTAKLMGNYYSEGLASALVTKTERMEGVEELLRR